MPFDSYLDHLLKCQIKKYYPFQTKYCIWFKSNNQKNVPAILQILKTGGEKNIDIIPMRTLFFPAIYLYHLYNPYSDKALTDGQYCHLFVSNFL